MDMKPIIAMLTSAGIDAAAEQPLARRSSFGIGGPAELVAFPKNAAELEFTIEILKSRAAPYIVIGNGTNVLFADEGYRGCVIFTERMNGIRTDGDRLSAGAGASFTAMATAAKNASLSGLEFAYGIPGSCGGAVVMNAGAYGGQVSDVLEVCEVYNTETRETLSLSADELQLSYRHSIFSDNGSLICLGATFSLKEGNKEDIDAVMRELMQRRISKQPLEHPSAGSVFKRPASELYVGKMIEESGLKGFRIGGAMVSEKHAGFIVNAGGATAGDVLELIDHIKRVIMQGYGIELECEIRRIGAGG